MGILCNNLQLVEYLLISLIIQSYTGTNLWAVLTDLDAKNLWTAAWLTVHGGIAVNAPPMVNVQNVLRIVGSGLKLARKQSSMAFFCKSTRRETLSALYILKIVHYFSLHL